MEVIFNVVGVVVMASDGQCWIRKELGTFTSKFNVHVIHSHKVRNVGLPLPPPHISLPLGNEVPISNANHADNVDNTMTSTMQGQQ